MKPLNKSTIVTVMVTLVIGMGLGWVFFGGNDSSTYEQEPGSETMKRTWTCSMHPQVRQPEPGKCPLCGMDLIPVLGYESEENSREIKMSATAMQLANVQTSMVAMQIPFMEIRLDGKVQTDERRVSSQTSHISGRIEQLLINYTGEYVAKGQTIAYVYSPELVTAQEELFEASKIKETQPGLFEAVKEKLKNWKLTDEQIAGIIQSDITLEHFPILSDLTGIVTAKYVNLGDHVQQGSSLYQVTDLSKIWVLFDIYESDISQVKKGDEITFTIQSLPGEKFKDKISFIDPVINPKTRVARARIALDNPGQRLKPEMFASGLLKSPLTDSKLSIVVPKSAVMWTGKRSVVYVRSPATSAVSFSLRKITLGTSFADSYVIVEGLEDGEEIATNGTFSIDAAAQLAGKPSMMNPERGKVMTGRNHRDDIKMENMESSQVKINISDQTFEINDRFKNQLKKVFETYLPLKEALVNTDSANALEMAKYLMAGIEQIDMSLVKGEAHQVWMRDMEVLKTSIEIIIQKNEIENIRKAFSLLSDQLYHTLIKFEVEGLNAYRQYCPMALDNKGAFWLSGEKQIRNP